MLAFIESLKGEKIDIFLRIKNPLDLILQGGGK